MLFQSNNNYKATSDQDKHLQKGATRNLFNQPVFLLCESKNGSLPLTGKTCGAVKISTISVCLEGGKCQRKEASFARSRGKADNPTPCNFSFNIIFIDLLHLSQYGRPTVLKSTNIHGGSCSPKVTTCKVSTLGP